MAPPDPSTNRTAGLGRSFRGLSTEDAPAHEHEAIPGSCRQPRSRRSHLVRGAPSCPLAKTDAEGGT